MKTKEKLIDELNYLRAIMHMTYGSGLNEKGYKRLALLEKRIRQY
jgi:hypothetical protein